MNYRCKRCLYTGIMWLLLSFKWSIICHQVIKLRQKLNCMVAENRAAVRLQQQEWGHIRQDAGEKMGVGRAWESAMKKACQHYLFYWFNSKGLPLKLYVALAGSIENTATNKKRFPKKLERFHLFIFYFYLLPTSTVLRGFLLRFHLIIFMSNCYGSTTYNSALPPKGINGTEEGKIIFYRTTVDSINHGRRFWVWKVMPMQKFLKINGQKWLTPGCNTKSEYETTTLVSSWFIPSVKSFLMSLWSQ